MTPVIKNGTIVTADLIHRADRLIEGGSIVGMCQRRTGGWRCSG
jgi:dihydroorotase-like cyclic amidohydrolase